MDGIRRFIPTYLDTIWTPSYKHRTLKLGNLLQSFNNPDIIDIKIGTESWDPDGTSEKIAYKRAKWANQVQVGLNIEGMSVDGQHQSKSYFKGLQDEKGGEAGILEAVRMYFQANTQHVPECLAQLDVLAAWFEQQTALKFISSSVLIICDPEKCGVHMVDFAHVWPTNTKDVCYLTGLKNLCGMIRCLQ